VTLPPEAAPPGTSRARELHPVLVGVALVLLAVNLRTTVASLPPLLHEIERDLGLSGATAGLLTALPVLCMAFFAPMAHRLAHRFGREATALGAVALVGAGNALRLAGDSSAVLFGATFGAGLGVAVCGVVLPGIVKELFSRRTGAATGAYSVAMMLGAASAAALAVPLERWLGSWQASLAAWAVPAVLAVVAWVPVTARVNEREPEEEEVAVGRLPWRSRSAWLLAAFFSLQASLAYAVLGWLAPAYQARGWSAEAAGALLGGNNLAQLAAALVLPALADRSTDRRPVLIGAVGCTVVGAAWLFAFPDVLPWVASTVVGLGLGGGFSLALLLLVDYAANASASGRLAAMVFLVGYTSAAVAPVAVGALRDVTGGFTVPFLLLVLLAIAELAMATRLGPKYRATVS
jgi:CP family cyanate transporter-like MFS transporter